MCAPQDAADRALATRTATSKKKPTVGSAIWWNGFVRAAADWRGGLGPGHEWAGCGRDRPTRGAPSSIWCAVIWSATATTQNPQRAQSQHRPRPANLAPLSRRRCNGCVSALLICQRRDSSRDFPTTLRPAGAALGTASCVPSVAAGALGVKRQNGGPCI